MGVPFHVPDAHTHTDTHCAHTHTHVHTLDMHTRAHTHILDAHTHTCALCPTRSNTQIGGVNTAEDSKYSHPSDGFIDFVAAR